MIFGIVGLFSFLHLVTGQNWDKIPKWADFGLYGPLGFKDLDFRLEFMMDNYEIISLEKCLNDDGNSDHMTVSYLSLYGTTQNNDSASILFNVLCNSLHTICFVKFTVCSVQYPMFELFDFLCFVQFV